METTKQKKKMIVKTWKHLNFCKGREAFNIFFFCYRNKNKWIYLKNNKHIKLKKKNNDDEKSENKNELNYLRVIYDYDSCYCICYVQFEHLFIRNVWQEYIHIL